MLRLQKLSNRFSLLSLCPLSSPSSRPVFVSLKLGRFDSVRTRGHLRTRSRTSVRTIMTVSGGADPTTPRLRALVPMNAGGGEDVGGSYAIGSVSASAVEDDGTFEIKYNTFYLFLKCCSE